ncbi:hypothetical protein [Arthrobacter sp. H-02-3]|uniref:hypothetical protein n=1 Tax=Arthrobacter sp. H-02-3 TaxID=2703675 RepID=UPI000DD2243B|nr:hypothetical protein [Arthrobacter sp. H-02-3]PVZ56670.1 hypothetical protein C9424_10675 [Arthrobacter sp. H-02-3]
MTSSTSSASQAVPREGEAAGRRHPAQCPARRSGLRYTGLLALAASLALAGCTAAPAPAPEQSAAVPTSAPTPTATSGVAPGDEPLTHDGRTVAPSTGDRCAQPALPDVRRVLGAVAANVQPAEAQASSKDGVADVVCTFALAPVGAGEAADVGNALLVARTTAPDQAALDGLGLPRLMMSPEPVPDLGAKAWYSVNRLSGTTEYVLEAANGLTVVRVTLALPADAAEPENLKAELAELAKLS